MVLLLLPAVMHLLKGKRLLNNLDGKSEEKLDQLEGEGKKAIDMAVTLNVSFIIVHFMLFGAAAIENISLNVLFISLFIFLVSMILTTVVEFSAIKCIQTNDNRIKGDPSRLNFQREYLKSCDEVEKFRIYKSAYKSFQFTKIVGFICLFISMLGNMLLNTGLLPVLLTGTILLSLVLSYSGSAMSKTV